MKPSVRSIFSIKNIDDFKKRALETFNYQAINNPLYKQYLDFLKINVATITEINKIPFLPISFFKTHPILSNEANTPSTQVFTSSGTTGAEQSKHYVTDLSIYKESYETAFRIFYGDVSNYCILALLPSYLERDGSSLIYMAEDLIKKSNHAQSGFYLHEYDALIEKLQTLEKAKQKTILLGVTYALLDVIEQLNATNKKLVLEHTIVMETGGMKGKRKEMIREELHALLCEGFSVKTIHSEYGMTELLSQAYSKGNGIFYCPPWMQVLVRDTNDPFTFLHPYKTGGINIIDLANINSCAFIATQDLGKVIDNNAFEIVGRFDNSDIRGCNLLIE